MGPAWEPGRQRIQVLCQLSYVTNRDGGTRTRNHLMKDEGTPVCASGRHDVKEHDDRRDIA